MRATVVVVVVVTALGAAASCARERAPALVDQVARVEDASVLAADSIPLPPRLVMLDSDGTVRVADAPRDAATLAELSRRPKPAGRPVTLADLRRDRRPPSATAHDVHGIDPEEPGDAKPAAPELPTRRGQVIGEIFDEAGREASAVVIAAPMTRASALVDTVTASGGVVAVAHRGTLRALKLELGLHAPELRPPATWIELRIDRGGLDVENVPDVAERVPWQSGSVDGEGLARALTSARKHRQLARRLDVDVLVSPDVSIQRLVDVLVRLEALGVRVVALGHAPPPGSEEAARRGRRIVAVIPGSPSAVGDLDKALIRKEVRARVPDLRACYDDALARAPTLAGTISTQFFIAPNGNVAQANASGVHPDLAACFARVIKSIAFPKPSGGGGVQVSYPFVLRS